jgi:uncharacterized protein
MSLALKTGTLPSPRATSPPSTICSLKTFCGTSKRNQLVGEYRGRDAVDGLFGRLMELTEGTCHLDVHAVLADDAHGVALVVTTASRASRSITTKNAHVFHLRDGRVTQFWDVSTDQYSTDEIIG